MMRELKAEGADIPGLPEPRIMEYLKEEEGNRENGIEGSSD